MAIIGYLGFVAGPALIGAVSSLRGGFLFLCAVAVILAACAPILRHVVREIGG